MRRKRVKFKNSEKLKKRRRDMATKADITELKTLTNPPVIVQKVVCSYAFLMGDSAKLTEKTFQANWKSASKMLTIEQVKAFDSSEKFDETRIEAVKKLLNNTNSAQVKKVSAASVSLYKLILKKLNMEETKPITTSEQESSQAETKQTKEFRTQIKTTITKGALIELKSLFKPPAAVPPTVRAFLLLLGMGDHKDWGAQKKHLADYNLLKRINQFDVTKISQADMKKSKRILNSVCDLSSPESKTELSSKSSTLGELVRWCIEVFEYEPADEVQISQPLRNPFKLSVIPIQVSA